MTQSAFDHWFNMIADTDYSDRCYRKKKFHQRRSPTGKYQIDEDVWARHPNDDVMYIASVIAVDKYHHTCRITFVNDGQTFNLPVGHLRHVTLEDIQCNRYVDYGHTWYERTSIGAINTYDRYGELQQVQFMGTSKDIYNDFDTVERTECIDDDSIDDIALTSDIDDDKGKDQTKAVLRLLPVLLEEMDNAQLLEIWPDLNIHLIEKLRRQPSSTELNTSKGDSTFGLKAQPLFLDNMKESEHHILSCHENNVSRSSKELPDINYHPIENTCPFLTINDAQLDTLSQELFDQQLLLESTRGEEYESLASIPRLQDCPTVKEVGTQTETTSNIPTGTTNPKQESIAMAYANQPAKDVPSLTVYTKKKSHTRTSIDQRQIHKDAATTTTYGFTKFLLCSLLVAVIICQLSTRSIINEENMNSVPFTTRHMISTDIIYTNPIPILITTMISFSSILDGPSRSMLELWFYPFAVP